MIFHEAEFNNRRKNLDDAQRDFTAIVRQADWEIGPVMFNGKKQELSIPIPGAIQAENAGLAAVALKTAFPDICDDAIRRGLALVKIPARFEKIAGVMTPALLANSKNP